MFHVAFFVAAELGISNVIIEGDSLVVWKQVTERLNPDWLIDGEICNIRCILDEHPQ